MVKVTFIALPPHDCPLASHSSHFFAEKLILSTPHTTSGVLARRISTPGLKKQLLSEMPGTDKPEWVAQVGAVYPMYWKSVRQQNLPATIKYPEMVAEIFPHFPGNEIP